MNASQIVAIVSGMKAANMHDDVIAQALAAVGVGISTTDQPVANVPQPTGNGHAAAIQPTNRRRAGLIPSVQYRLVRGMTRQRIEALGLPDQQTEIALAVLATGAMGRRDITTRLGHATHKVTESAVYALRTRGVLESVALDAPAVSQRPARATTTPVKRSNAVKLSKRGK